MQSPFKLVVANKTNKDIDTTGTDLFFDFLGLFVTLGSITVFIVQAIKLGMYLRTNGSEFISKIVSDPFSIFSYGKKWKFAGKKGKWFKRLRWFSSFWIGAGVLVTLLVIFVVGMLRTAESAWTTAR